MTDKPQLTITAIAEPKECDGMTLWPLNVCNGGVACTIRARYNALGTAKEVLDLSHFPKTAVLIEYDGE